MKGPVQELSLFLMDHADEIRAFGVERLGVFGSFARGDQTAASDVDFMVVFVSGKQKFRTFMALADFLEESAGRRIELLTPESLSPHVRVQILAQVEYVPFAA